MNQLKNKASLLAIAIALIACNNAPKQKSSEAAATEPQKAEAPAPEAPAVVAFEKQLSLQDITFTVTATGEGSIQKLTVQPSGYSQVNDKVEMEVDGTVYKAEIEDLDADGAPELFIFARSAGSGSYGKVIAFSSNKKASMSMVYFPDITENPEASKDFMGHDEFELVENTLVQRFRLAKEGDTNAQQTGDYRQIQYKLVNGEASKKLVVDKIVQFPAQ